MRLFVTAIGTDCGKTITSAIFTQHYQADYWKPIQSGLESIDRVTVQNLVANLKTNFHPERFLFKNPLSPHHAAELEGVSIHLDDFELPKTENNLIVEGAGGVLVPLNYSGNFVIDIAQKLECELVVVCNIYLGSINHTLLTINELQRRNLPIKGIVFNGVPNIPSQKIILEHCGLPCLLHIQQEKNFTKELITQYAKQILI